MTKSDLEISPKVSVFDPHPPSTHISDFVLPKKGRVFSGSLQINLIPIILDSNHAILLTLHSPSIDMIGAPFLIEIVRAQTSSLFLEDFAQQLLIDQKLERTYLMVMGRLLNTQVGTFYKISCRAITINKKQLRLIAD